MKRYFIIILLTGFPIVAMEQKNALETWQIPVPQDSLSQDSSRAGSPGYGYYDLEDQIVEYDPLSLLGIPINSNVATIVLGQHINDWELSETAFHFLRAYGAQVDGMIEGIPFICHALQRGNSDAFNLLLDHGANPNAVITAEKNRGDYPLLLAILCNYLDGVNKLLAHGAWANGVNGTDMRSLHLAAYYGNEEIVAALLGAGADVDLLVKGQTPLQIAISRGFTKVVHLFEVVYDRRVCDRRENGPSNKRGSDRFKVSKSKK